MKVSIVYLVRQIETMREKLEAAERERDEAIKQRDKHGEGFYKAVQYGARLEEKLEAELARRYAAEGESVPTITFNKNFVAVDGSKPFWNDMPVVSSCNWLPDGSYKVYLSPPPAVLPPAISTDGLDPESRDIDEVRNLAHIVGANWMRQQCLELGAQQQKVVELPTPYDIGKGDRRYYDITGWHFDREELIAALDAANVKWEVKS